MATSQIPRRYQTVEQPFISGNAVELLRDGAEAYPSMLAAIAAAKWQVLLEMYWFDSDPAGLQFADALRAAAERGVEVAVTYDAVGSFGADPAMFSALRSAGVRVLEFNPIAPWRRRFRLDRLTLRDHRKILVIDEEIGFTGGCNLALAWLPIDDGGRGWRDDMVCVRGPAAHALAGSVLRTWRALGGPPLQWSRPSRTHFCRTRGRR